MVEQDDEMIERARVLAEATGRDLDDVLADLADDGILNESNKEGKDLITELKEAAALMEVVKDINKEVSENSVLNGGNNKTEVAVDTTLEGDIVDRAIASAHRKVVELKKIALILAPVFLLVSGGSLEALGIINMFGGDEDEDDEWDEPIYIEYWGCTDWQAINYDEYANMDDGSCEYDVYGCTNDAASNYDPMATIDDGSCEPEPVYGCMDEEAENYDPDATEDDNSCEYPPEPIEGCTDSDAENYDPEAENDDGSCEYEEESNIDDCTVEIHNHYRGHANNDASSDTMIVAFKVVPNGCDDFLLDVRIELFQHGEAPNYTQEYQLPGDSEHDIETDFEDMPPGTWIPKIRVGVEGEQKANVNFWALDIEEQEPPCQGEASFYNSSYSISYNNTNNSSLANITVFWDADWSCQEIRYVEIDVYALFNNTTIRYQTIGYNLNGQSPTLANYTFIDLEVAKTYEVYLIVWVDRDGWEQDDEQTMTVSIS